MLWLPTATRDPHGRSLSFSETTDPKGCLHTTESSGWPGYRDWTVHPHGTIRPIRNRGIEIRQHVPLNRASFALRNLSGGPETNRDYVFQWELIGTSEKGGPGYFWPDADDIVLEALYYRLIKPLWDAVGVPIHSLPFQAYPSSYGDKGKTNRVRLTGSQFDNYTGWLGHQHVPENVHGDPGAFPWDRMMKLVQPKNPKPPVDVPASPEKEIIDEVEEEIELLAYYNPADDTDGKGPDTAEAFAIAGNGLRHVSAAEVTAIRNAGGVVRFIGLPANDILWKMEKL